MAKVPCRAQAHVTDGRKHGRGATSDGDPSVDVDLGPTVDGAVL